MTVCFHVLFTLYQESFSAFVHTTYLLSVLCLFLGLEVNSPYSIWNSNQIYSLRQKNAKNNYRTITLYRQLFQTSLLFLRFPYVSPHLLADSVCPVLLSVYLLTASQLISFPAHTKIFQFCAFTFLTKYTPKSISMLIQESEDYRLLAPSLSLSQLATPFFVA